MLESNLMLRIARVVSSHRNERKFILFQRGSIPIHVSWREKEEFHKRGIEIYEWEELNDPFASLSGASSSNNVIKVQQIFRYRCTNGYSSFKMWYR